MFPLRHKTSIDIHLMGHLVPLTIHTPHAAFREQFTPIVRTMRTFETRRLRMIVVLSTYRNRLSIRFFHKQAELLVEVAQLELGKVDLRGALVLVLVLPLVRPLDGILLAHAHLRRADY